VIVANKQDLGAAWDPAEVGGGAVVVVASMTTGQGVEGIRAAVGEALLGPGPLGEVPGVTNVRHLALLRRAREAVERARQAAAGGLPEEFVAADVGEGRAALEEMTGRRTTEGLLENIFSRFCVGK